jgi:hypothetical protein
MGIYSALTGGLANSGAVSAAAQAGQYWSDKLMDVIPELAEGAYDRYLQEIENDRKVLNDIMAVDTLLFDREYKVNSDVKNDILAAQENAEQRDAAVNEYNLERDKLAAEQQESADKLAYERYRDDADRAAQESQNTFQNALNLFKSTGSVSTDIMSAILGIPVGSITADMKSLFTKLASETEKAEQQYEYSTALEKLKNSNSLQQIYAKKN